MRCYARAPAGMPHLGKLVNVHLAVRACTTRHLGHCVGLVLAIALPLTALAALAELHIGIETARNLLAGACCLTSALLPTIQAAVSGMQAHRRQANFIADAFEKHCSG